MDDATSMPNHHPPLVSAIQRRCPLVTIKHSKYLHYCVDILVVVVVLVVCMLVTVVAQLRQFVKSCKVPAYTRKMKELIGKITETSTMISERRQAATLNLQDLNAVVCFVTMLLLCDY